MSQVQKDNTIKERSMKKLWCGCGDKLREEKVVNGKFVDNSHHLFTSRKAKFGKSYWYCIGCDRTHEVVDGEPRELTEEQVKRVLHG